MASSEPRGPIIDHIVLLVPHDVLVDPPAWLTDAFTILPGGTHIDGLTQNKFIILPDGAYIELIAFAEGIDPAKKASHIWGRLSNGTIVAWALSFVPDPPAPADHHDHHHDSEAADAAVFAAALSLDRPLVGEAAFQAIRGRVDAAGAAYLYGELTPGGRALADGTPVQWAVAAGRARDDGGDAAGDFYRTPGRLPFWCLDRTPRTRRVLTTAPGDTAHPVGAVGVAGLKVSLADARRVEDVGAVYDAIFNAKASASAAGGAREWDLPSPVPTGSSGGAKLSVGTLEGGRADAGVLIELALFTKGKGGHVSGDLGEGVKISFALIPL